MIREVWWVESSLASEFRKTVKGNMLFFVMVFFSVKGHRVFSVLCLCLPTGKRMKDGWLCELKMIQLIHSIWCVLFSYLYRNASESRHPNIFHYAVGKLQLINVINNVMLYSINRWFMTIKVIAKSRTISKGSTDPQTWRTLMKCWKQIWHPQFYIDDLLSTVKEEILHPHNTLAK